jgi:hypothetical protein
MFRHLRAILRERLRPVLYIHIYIYIYYIIYLAYIQHNGDVSFETNLNTHNWHKSKLNYLLLKENQQMHQNNHLIVMASHTLLHVPAY